MTENQQELEATGPSPSDVFSALSEAFTELGPGFVKAQILMATEKQFVCRLYQTQGDDYESAVVDL